MLAIGTLCAVSEQPAPARGLSGLEALLCAPGRIAQELTDEFMVLQKAVNDLYDGNPRTIEEEKARDEMVDPLRRRQHEIWREFEAKPPANFSGLRALAKTIVAYSPDLLLEGEAYTAEDRVIRVLLRSLATDA
jgi:hypothetical protein